LDDLPYAPPPCYLHGWSPSRQQVQEESNQPADTCNNAVHMQQYDSRSNLTMMSSSRCIRPLECGKVATYYMHLSVCLSTATTLSRRSRTPTSQTLLIDPYNTSPDGNPFVTNPWIQHPLMFSNSDPLVAVPVYLNVAEDTNCPKHHENHFHQWIEDTYHSNWVVQALTKKDLQQFFEKGQFTCQKCNGYPHQTAQIITSIA
jgi:hypothetical protein